MPVQAPDIKEMLDVGTHFGHTKARRYPKMAPFIQMTRGGIDVFDLEQSTLLFQAALDFVEKIIVQGGIVLFVGTKKQARECIERYAKEADAPYVIGRWLGGTFTNFSSIITLVKELQRLEGLLADPETKKKFVKKEIMDFEKQHKKLLESVGGIRNMVKLPQAVVVIDIKKERSVIREAKKLCIPVIALIDSIVNPDLVQYGVPGNDDAVRSVELFVAKIADAIKSGKDARKKAAAAK